MPTRGRSVSKSRTRSCGSARPSPNRGLDAGAETIAAHLATVGIGPGAGGLDDLADPVSSRVRHSAAAETATVVVAAVLRRPAQRTLAGRHHPLAARRRHRGRDLQHSRRPLPGLHRLAARPIITGPEVSAGLSRRIHPLGHPGQRAHRQRGSLHREATRRRPGRSRGRSSDCAGSGSATPGPTIRRPAARWNGSTRPRRNGWPRNHRPPRSAGLQRQLTGSAATTTPSGRTEPLGRRTPAQAYAARPKAVPTARSSPPTTGSATTRSTAGERSACATTAGSTTSASAPDLPAPLSPCSSTTCTSASSSATPAQLIRELILDPTRDYQPRGLPPGPPKQTAVTPRAASRSRPNRATAAEVKAGRRPPAGPRP